MACFADDPAAYLADKIDRTHYLPTGEQAALQLEALQQRFVELRDAIAPLKALADASQTEKIRRIEDVAPLLFPHSLHKSYPAHLIDNFRFPELTEWLSRLTIHDLSAVKGRSFETFDRWMDALDVDTDISIVTSSATTEALSLIPRGKREFDLVKKRFAASWLRIGDAPPAAVTEIEHSVMWLSYARGRSGITRVGEFLRELAAGTAHQMLPLIPERLSTDWQIYVARATQAEKLGMPAPAVSGYLQEKIDEAANIHQRFDERITYLLQALRDSFYTTPVIMMGGPILLHRMAAAGLKMGMAPGLARGSIVRSIGGTKGLPEPENMEASIKRFGGTTLIDEGYAMTELNQLCKMCSCGNYHVPVCAIPFVFDIEGGGLLPRRGTQHGRAAFVDLTARTYWGGVVSADEVTLSWDQCECRCTTPYILPSISRIPASEHNEHVLGGASARAIHAALQALNADL